MSLIKIVSYLTAIVFVVLIIAFFSSGMLPLILAAFFVYAAYLFVKFIFEYKSDEQSGKNKTSGEK